MSHESFARFNGWDYMILGDEINEIYGLNQWRNTWVDATAHCLGMNKWYATDWAFKHRGYEQILFVDFDSKFLKNELLDLGEADLKLYKMIMSPYYDSFWFLYYCMHKGIKLEQLNNALPYKFNSGFFKTTPGFVTQDDMDDFVDVACNTVADIMFKRKNGWMNLHNVELHRINEMHNTTVTPFDEVFLAYQVMIKSPTVEYFPYTFNVNNADLITEDTAHIHFCTNKEEDMQAICIPGIAEFLNES
jgi:hypothetical protein